jgi:hypothetical protein
MDRILKLHRPQGLPPFIGTGDRIILDSYEDLFTHKNIRPLPGKINEVNALRKKFFHLKNSLNFLSERTFTVHYFNDLSPSAWPPMKQNFVFNGDNIYLSSDFYGPPDHYHMSITSQTLFWKVFNAWGITITLEDNSFDTELHRSFANALDRIKIDKLFCFVNLDCNDKVIDAYYFSKFDLDQSCVHWIAQKMKIAV